MDAYSDQLQAIVDVSGLFPSRGERVNHALNAHYVVGDLLARLSQGVYIIEERVELSSKMGKRRIIEFAVEDMPTNAPAWQIEANRYLGAKRDYLFLPDEAFKDYGGREVYKEYWLEAMRGRLGRRGAATIMGVCSNDYRSWQDETSTNLGYQLQDKERLFHHFQGVREVLDGFSDAISRKDYYLQASVRGILEELRVPKSIFSNLLRVRGTVLDYAEFRVVREMNGQLVTIYPLLLRYSDDS